MILQQTHQQTPTQDDWEAYLDIRQHGGLTLSSIELTTTYLCNMRCEHCAVGDILALKDPNPIAMEKIFAKLDDIPHLRTLSLTGGEPLFSKKSLDQVILPLLKYAKSRDVRTQINSNLTMPFERYEAIAPYLDVLHISHNWGTLEDFMEGGFTNMQTPPPKAIRRRQFDKMIENSRRLSELGVFISAETMLNKRTLPYIEEIHRQVVNEMKCSRHEIHPMYPVSFASNLDVLSLEETRDAIHRLLDVRDSDSWMLFGTLPFYSCNASIEDQQLLARLRVQKNVTVRNDPDGRSRLNVNIFTGDVAVTDFGEAAKVGNLLENSLPDIYKRWVTTESASSMNCHCPAVSCLGPNLLVKEAYYPTVDFTTRTAKI
ncbi:radical SAM/CxCxxxxC motif protein YfkAB [Chryseomicrobium sp. FSL W7-1435]|uniref:radical SAM/CxCxxxxC motif protein YfkAB n=1 Tax=Chryseomicrobium sp. FSL W7-1435 TaxID=2921704 RepID=UPI00315A7DD7